MWGYKSELAKIIYIGVMFSRWTIDLVKDLWYVEFVSEGFFADTPVGWQKFCYFPNSPLDRTSGGSSLTRYCQASLEATYQGATCIREYRDSSKEKVHWMDNLEKDLLRLPSEILPRVLSLRTAIIHI